MKRKELTVGGAFLCTAGYGGQSIVIPLKEGAWCRNRYSWSYSARHQEKDPNAIPFHPASTAKYSGDSRNGVLVARASIGYGRGWANITADNLDWRVEVVQLRDIEQQLLAPGDDLVEYLAKRSKAAKEAALKRKLQENENERKTTHQANRGMRVAMSLGLKYQAKTWTRDRIYDDETILVDANPTTCTVTLRVDALERLIEQLGDRDLDLFKHEASS